jgi:hypothetical protein
MDRVKSPQPRDAVEQTVGDVKAQVGQDDGLDHLDPVALSSNSGP